MKLTIRFCLLILGACTALVACEKNSAPASDNQASKSPAVQAKGVRTVNLAVAGGLTGTGAQFGKDAAHGAELAIEEVNQKGITIAGQQIHFNLMVEDDGCDPRQATLVAQRLVDAGVVGVIGHLTSGTSIPASQIYAKAGIPLITASTTSLEYTRQGLKNTFRVLADDARLASVLGTYAVKKLHAKTFAVIDDRTTYGVGLSKNFVKVIQEQGGTVVAAEFTSDHANDFQAILTNIKSKKPDLIFFGGMYSVGGTMFNQIDQLGIKSIFMGGDGLCTDAMLKLASRAVADQLPLYCARSGGVDVHNTQSMRNFEAKYQAKFHQAPQSYAVTAYDAVMVLVAGMEKAQSTTPAKYLPVLARTTQYAGATGSLTFNEQGDLVDGSVEVRSLVKGKWMVAGVIH